MDRSLRRALRKHHQMQRSLTAIMAITPIPPVATITSGKMEVQGIITAKGVFEQSFEAFVRWMQPEDDHKFTRNEWNIIEALDANGVKLGKRDYFISADDDLIKSVIAQAHGVTVNEQLLAFQFESIATFRRIDDEIELTQFDRVSCDAPFAISGEYGGGKTFKGSLTLPTLPTGGRFQFTGTGKEN